MKPSLKKYWPALAVGIALAGAGLWAWPARRVAKPTVPVDVSFDSILDRKLNNTHPDLPRTFRTSKCETTVYGPAVLWLITNDPRQVAQQEIADGDWRVYGSLHENQARVGIEAFTCDAAAIPQLRGYMRKSLHETFNRPDHLRRPGRGKDKVPDYDPSPPACSSHYHQLQYKFAFLVNQSKISDPNAPYGLACTNAAYSRQRLDPIIEPWP
ncbi:MAG: hypothetical protein ABL901_16945 [Hyphomicrobiaceae bacterium]|nr:hypothetical protein [Hyphomicrobiaceae bacterium]